MTDAPEYGRIWFDALARDRRAGQLPSLRVGSGLFDDCDAAILAVVPDPDARFPRARRGEVGLEEGWAFAAAVRDIAASAPGRPIVVVVDVPGQAYGYVEELAAVHQALAAAADALAHARRAGHAVVAFVVGRAISGAFLAIGLQANRLVALDHDGVAVQVMSAQAQARITRRSTTELAEIARIVPATAADVRGFAQLGALHALVAVNGPDAPTDEDVAVVRRVIADAVRDAQADDPDLGARLRSSESHTGRALSRQVRALVDAQWNP